MELGASANYRQTYLDPNNYTISTSYTGDLAYYFMESAAFELSYTRGNASNISSFYTASVQFQLTGLDFILSFGSKDSAIRPYFKLGVAQQIKQTLYQQPGFDPIIERVSGVSPSLGAGFKIGLTETFGIRVGAEAWSSPLWNKEYSVSTTGSTVVSGDTSTTYDIAVRGGLSWIF